MRVCDWIAEYAYLQGIVNVHGLMGGGAAGLNDGFIKNKNINYICYHHEQGAGHAAVGESKFTGLPSLVNPTTGCGGTNCATSVLNAWQDSVPVIFISGNVRLDTCSGWINQQKGLNIRKYGIQEHHVVDTYKSMTKFSHFVTSVEEVFPVIQKAFHIAMDGRKGPVWIDIPADIQLAPISESYEMYNPQQYEFDIDNIDTSKIELKILESKRPLVLAGYGIRQSSSVEFFKQFINKYNLPFVSTYGARDYVNDDNLFSIGAVGQRGSRAGNFALQNADLLIILGSSLNASVLGYDPKQFSPYSYKIHVDIDSSELNKEIVKTDLKIQQDLRTFLSKFVDMNDIGRLSHPYHNIWLDKVNNWKDKWPVIKDVGIDDNEEKINLYSVLETLNNHTDSKHILMGDAGSISYAGPVFLRAQKDQRFIFNPAQADMGWALPGSIGVSLISNQPVVSIIGDGSFMSNIQELAVVKQFNLDIKFVILNNDGYLSIMNTQNKFFEGRVYGTSKGKGLWFPDFGDVAKSYGIKYHKIESSKNINEIQCLLEVEGPLIIDCICVKEQQILPSQSFKNGKQAPLHDLVPFLPEEEIEKEIQDKRLL